ncbi:hypothetical protein VZG28_04815 [Synechococcus elongatus IITB4]|uniref:hypothetical protein n=1 Tax=Synechococcus elongatus TaxID=32046 RepID=UPI0030D3969A
MRYAKSIYRGGAIIDAIACDYSSSRSLGLVCPFCSEPVFYRAGSKYQREGTTVERAALFSHYQGDDDHACELRAIRKEGQDYITKLEAEAKGQRLELYNRHAWALIRKKLKSLPKFFDVAEKAFGDRYVQQQVKAIRQYLFTDLEEVVLEGLEAYDRLVDRRTGILPKDRFFTDLEIISDLMIVNLEDKPLQKKIIEELIRFLATPKAKWLVAKLTVMSLTQLAVYLSGQITEQGASKEIINAIAGHIKQSYDHKDFMGQILQTLAIVNWMQLFTELESRNELKSGK